MYAIIETGGKQYRVAEGDVLRVERLQAEPDAEVSFDRVLAIVGEEPRFGAPLVEGARAVGRVLEHGRAGKIVVLKYKPKVNYRKKTGHRQAYTAVRIERIEG